MPRTVLIDGDIVAYRCGFAAEHTRYHVTVDNMVYKFDNKSSMNEWLKEHEPTEYSWTSELEVEPLNFVLGTAKRMVSNIVEGCAADEFRLFLSDRRNFRHDVATILKYKGNRDKRRAPLHIKDIRRYLIDIQGAEIMPNLEADDALAMLQTKDTVIASIDKDLLQIPGKHYNFVNGNKLLVSKETGLRNKMSQILTGDSTDNIPGIYRVGPKTAEKLLAECASEEQMRVVLYEQWDKYLMEGKVPPEWLVDYDGLNTVIYTGWEGNEITTSLDKIIGEIERLITVGEVPEDGTKTQGA